MVQQPLPYKVGDKNFSGFLADGSGGRKVPGASSAAERRPRTVKGMPAFAFR
jgi:hypothetical protein